ncbi:Uma2 family endonuclease [soil metagenome]|jgi:Uma2 family endonuclease
MVYAVPNKIYSLEEYLELDFRTDAKYEFFDGRLVEISGVAINHALINGNLLSILHENLTVNFQSWIGSMKLKVPALPPYRYPNLSVSPKKAQFELVGEHQCLTNPILIGEIYSPETETYDCGEKFEAYKSIESFREYILVDQEKKFVTLYTKYDKEVWFQTEYVEGETLKLESLDCELSVDEIYQGIVFES